MNKVLLFFAACFLVFGCGKPAQPPAPVNNGLVMTIMAGNDQSGPVGYPLTTPVVVKLTQSGQPVAGYHVQFIGAGCGADFIADLFTGADGTATYSWTMPAEQGNQNLNIVAINGKRVDSVSAIATATAQTGPVFRSACTPPQYGEPQSMCQLSTGRIFACFPGASSMLRYSDDDGTTWKGVKTLETEEVTSITVTPQDEIFALIGGVGVLYSADKGATWSNVSPPGTSPHGEYSTINYTPGGKLMITGYVSQIWVSPDKGKTWTNGNVAYQSSYNYLNPVEAKNGNLYMLSNDYQLFESTDSGANWKAASNKNLESILSLYVDKNGNFYEGRNDADGGVFVSADNRATFKTLVALNNAWPENVSAQPNGDVYYGEVAVGISKINAAGQVTSLTATSSFNPVYLVSKTGRLLYANKGGIYYQ